MVKAWCLYPYMKCLKYSFIRTSQRWKLWDLLKGWEKMKCGDICLQNIHLVFLLDAFFFMVSILYCALDTSWPQSLLNSPSQIICSLQIIFNKLHLCEKSFDLTLISYHNMHSSIHNNSQQDYSQRRLNTMRR